MTAKEFFKGTAFKCIVTLFCILLVCGIFLTIMYGFMEVTDKERLNRAISKIYGRDIEVTEVEYTDEQSVYSTSTIIEAYEDAEGNYLVKAKGKGGFGGTVTCWVLVNMKDGAVNGIGKVIVETSDGETFLDKINYLDKFANTTYTEGFEYSTGNGFVTSGASLSSTAINNSVNGAITFINTVCLGKEDPYAAYKYYDYIDMAKTEWSVDSGNVTYTVVTKGYVQSHFFTFEIVVDSNKTITGYVIKSQLGSGPEGPTYGFEESMPENVKDGSVFVGKDLSYFTGILGDKMEYPGDHAGTAISTGATNSNYLCYVAGAFAIANYDYITNPPAEEEGGAA